MFTLKICRDQTDYQNAQKIAKQYVQWLGIDLTFQNIDLEWNQFESMYGDEAGGYLIALTPKGHVVGGVGIRKQSDGVCEMKRLFVLEEHGGHGIGKALCIQAMALGKSLGYKAMRLDTVARLRAANYLYETLGFVDIAAYTENPDPTARFLEISLNNFDPKSHDLSDAIILETVKPTQSENMEPA